MTSLQPIKTLYLFRYDYDEYGAPKVLRPRRRPLTGHRGQVASILVIPEMAQVWKYSAVLERKLEHPQETIKPFPVVCRHVPLPCTVSRLPAGGKLAHLSWFAVVPCFRVAAIEQAVTGDLCGVVLVWALGGSTSALGRASQTAATLACLQVMRITHHTCKKRHAGQVTKKNYQNRSSSKP